MVAVSTPLSPVSDGRSLPDASMFSYKVVSSRCPDVNSTLPHFVSKYERISLVVNHSSD